MRRARDGLSVLRAPRTMMVTRVLLTLALAIPVLAQSVPYDTSISVKDRLKIFDQIWNTI